MAGLLINLNQLETSMRRIKAYCDTNYSLKDHTHDERYYTKLEFDNIKDMLLTNIENKSDKDHTHTSENILKMTGYIKPEGTSAITTSDTLNTAIGKLEKALEGKQNTGDYAIREHNHNDAYYTKQEVTDLINEVSVSGNAGIEAAKKYADDAITSLVGNTTPESLDTLKELADALGNDPNFSTTVANSIAGKADKDHTHTDATITNSGFMSSSDKIKLDGIQENANNYVHPDTAGYKHIPAGGETGQALVYSEDGTAVWGTVSSTDQYVKNNLNTTAKAYITGTTSAVTEIGEQVFDTGVFLTENVGELQAKTFVGNLTGTADAALSAEKCTGNAASADKTKEALDIILNGAPQKSFNGSEAVAIQITASSVGAPTINQFNSATKQATDEEVLSMLDSIF